VGTHEGTFLQDWARGLVLLHASAAILLIGASTHHVLVAVGYLRGRFRLRLGRIYALVSALSYGFVVLLGALAYPTYRYHVRELHLDRYAVWASKLFDIKEDLASLGLPLIVAAFVLSRVIDPERDRSLCLGYAVIVCALGLIVWFNVLAGLLITLVKGI
jgi:hypothetical protein